MYLPIEVTRMASSQCCVDVLIQWIKQLKKSTNSVDYYNTVHLYILYSTVFELFEVHIYLTKSINVQPFYILIANAMYVL